MKVLNSTRGTTLATCAQIADTPKASRDGLLNRESIAPGEGLWIKPASSIHTFGMKFPIDVVFLNKDRFIVGIVPDMGPESSTGRFPYCKFDSVLELPAGTVAATGTREGDGLDFVAHYPEDVLRTVGLTAVALIAFVLLVIHHAK
jgi:uncharacterized membrane protein (UPF0127 family)